MLSDEKIKAKGSREALHERAPLDPALQGPIGRAPFWARGAHRKGPAERHLS
jgi:hypothetical protein